MNIKTFDVLSFGMLNCDVPISPVPVDLFERHVCMVNPITMVTGGDALNVATTLAKLNARVAAAGRVGNDSFGDFVIEQAINNNVNMSLVKRDENGYSTATTFHIICQNSNPHAQLANNEINEMLIDTDISDEAIKKSKILYFGSALSFKQMDEIGIEKLFKRAHKHNVLTAMDTSVDINYPTGSFAYKLLKPALAETDIFIPSISEISYLLEGEQDPFKIAKEMQQFNMKVFGIKLGSKGCYMTDFNKEFIMPTYSEFRPNDVTGAGDSFVGAFLKGITLDWDIELSAKFANVVASHNIAAIGATGGVPKLEDALCYLNNHELCYEVREYCK